MLWFWLSMRSCQQEIIGYDDLKIWRFGLLPLLMCWIPLPLDFSPLSDDLGKSRPFITFWMLFLSSLAKWIILPIDIPCGKDASTSWCSLDPEELQLWEKHNIIVVVKINCTGLSLCSRISTFDMLVFMFIEEFGQNDHTLITIGRCTKDFVNAIWSAPASLAL